LNDLSHRREGVNVFGVEIQFQGVEEVFGVFNFLRPFDE
jgi:hypothetical protein